MALRVLKISSNDISRIDLHDFPKLRILDADDNRLTTLIRTGSTQSRLNALSMRSQRVKQIDLPSREMANVRRLYISGETDPTIKRRT